MSDELEDVDELDEDELDEDELDEDEDDVESKRIAHASNKRIGTAKTKRGT